MTPESLSDVQAERDALKGEVAMLAEQLKLLVKAEHALTRSRREIERQHDRIQILARFAFDIAGIEAIDDVLSEAARALIDLFALEGVSVVRLDPSGHWVHVDGPREVSPASWEQLMRSQDAGVGPADAATPRALLEGLRVGETKVPPRTLVWIPIRPRPPEAPMILVGWTSLAGSAHREAPGPGHVPFLQLFGNHVSRAIDGAHLTTELRHQQAALTASNGQLQDSMQALERAQGQLLQAQKLEAIGRLAGGIAHDFNNLLTVILSHADLIRPSLGPGSEESEDLQMIVDAAGRASDITKRLLAFGRKQETSQHSVDLAKMTIEASKMFRRLIGDDIVLHLDLDPSIGRVRIDPVQLEQILMNLVVNARDAMPSGGRLTIEARRARHTDQALATSEGSANLVALSVRDTGMGMSEETKRQLFEPFFTTKPVGKGTGLGLATVYGLVKQNHGQIIVHSTVGEGSTFVVLLQSAEGVSGHRALPAQVQSRGTVLVVEDEDAIRRVVCRVLRQSGYEVVEANDGEQALRVARTVGRPLDLIVTDVVMPALGGPAMVEALRGDQPQVKVVFMSGHTFNRLDERTLNAGSDAFLPKPFTPDQLRRMVEGLVGAEAA